jgi:hypothetical protein
MNKQSRASSLRLARRSSLVLTKTQRIGQASGLRRGRTRSSGLCASLRSSKRAAGQSPQRYFGARGYGIPVERQMDWLRPEKRTGGLRFAWCQTRTGEARHCPPGLRQCGDRGPRAFFKDIPLPIWSMCSFKLSLQAIFLAARTFSPVRTWPSSSAGHPVNLSYTVHSSSGSFRIS